MTKRNKFKITTTAEAAATTIMTTTTTTFKFAEADLKEQATLQSCWQDGV